MPTENCSKCDRGLNLKWKRNSQACAVCKILAQCAADKKKSEAAIQRKHFLNEMRSLTGNKISKEVTMTNGDKKAISVGFTKLGNKHLYYDANSIFKSNIEFLTSLDKNLTNAVAGREVKLYKVRKDDIKQFYYFDSAINNTDVTLMVAEDIYKESSGKERLIRYLYSIKKR